LVKAVDIMIMLVIMRGSLVVPAPRIIVRILSINTENSLTVDFFADFFIVLYSNLLHLRPAGSTGSGSENARIEPGLLRL
jgi:hypothetical protein